MKYKAWARILQIIPLLILVPLIIVVIAPKGISVSTTTTKEIGWAILLIAIQVGFLIILFNKKSKEILNK